MFICKSEKPTWFKVKAQEISCYFSAIPTAITGHALGFEFICAVSDYSWLRDKIQKKTYTFGVPGCKPDATRCPQTGLALCNIYTVSRPNLYVLDPPSTRKASSENPVVELPTDCLKGRRSKHKLVVLWGVWARATFTALIMEGMTASVLVASLLSCLLLISLLSQQAMSQDQLHDPCR